MRDYDYKIRHKPWRELVQGRSPEARISLVCVIQSCMALCDPMDCSMPALHISHCLLEFAHVYVH